MRTCTAPTHQTCTDSATSNIEADPLASLEDPFAPFDAMYRLGPEIRAPEPSPTCEAEPPALCSGPTWPPLTAWERWALERAAGVRVPPSVSTWTERDVQRQQEAHALAQPAPVVDDPPSRPRLVTSPPVDAHTFARSGVR